MESKKETLSTGRTLLEHNLAELLERLYLDDGTLGEYLEVQCPVFFLRAGNVRTNRLTNALSPSLGHLSLVTPLGNRFTVFSGRIRVKGPWGVPELCFALVLERPTLCQAVDLLCPQGDGKDAEHEEEAKNKAFALAVPSAFLQ